MGFVSQELWFDSQQGQEVYIFFESIELTTEPIQPLIQWVPGTVFFWSKCQGMKPTAQPHLI